MRKRIRNSMGLVLTAALSLMAFASVAQAAENLEWGHKPGSGTPGFFLTSNGTRYPTGLTGEVPNKETVSGTQIGSGKLLIPAKSAEVTCAKGKVISGFIQNEYLDYLLTPPNDIKEGGHGHGTVLFEECEVNSINAAGELTGKLTKCTEELNKASSPEGKHHVTASGLILLRVHENVTYIVVEPLIASKADDESAAKLELPFTTLTFGGTCSLPGTVQVKGGAAATVPKTDSNKPKVKVDTFSAAGKAEQTLLGLQLTFGASPAFIAAEAEVELTGAEKAASWGGM